MDDIYIWIRGTAGQYFSTSRAHFGIYRNSRITLSVRLQCAANYYGSYCDFYCAPTNNSSGHYTCTIIGQTIQIVCLSGWTNPATFCVTRKSYTHVHLCEERFRVCIMDISDAFCSYLLHWLSCNRRVLQHSWNLSVSVKCTHPQCTIDAIILKIMLMTFILNFLARV